MNVIIHVMKQKMGVASGCCMRVKIYDYMNDGPLNKLKFSLFFFCKVQNIKLILIKSTTKPVKNIYQNQKTFVTNLYLKREW